MLYTLEMQSNERQEGGILGFFFFFFKFFLRMRGWCNSSQKENPRKEREKCILCWVFDIGTIQPNRNPERREMFEPFSSGT